jgi:uncharacterized protein
MNGHRDRDGDGRARQARPRDELGRPLPYGAVGVEPVSEEPMPPAETITAATALLGQGRPFSAHEVYEVRWKTCPEDERALWQGLAQVCVALTHEARGNHRGATRVLERATAAFSAYRVTAGPTYGLDLDDVISGAREEILGAR